MGNEREKIANSGINGFGKMDMHGLSGSDNMYRAILRAKELHNSSYLGQIESMFASKKVLFPDERMTRAFDSPARHFLNSITIPDYLRNNQSGFMASISKSVFDAGFSKSIYASMDIISKMKSPAIESVFRDSRMFLAQTERLFGNIPWHNLGNAIGLGVKQKELFGQRYFDLAQSYDGLLQSLEVPEVTLPPQGVLSGAAKELYTGTDVLESFSVIDEEENTEEIIQSRKEISESAEKNLPELLGDIDKALIPVWKGARLALRSDNPDRIRHYLASARELMNHLLHRLAPDVAIKAWDSSPNLYDKGKPTRKARMLYICRRINYGPFSEFLVKDLESVVHLFAFTNKLHDITLALDEWQLMVLSNRIDTAIEYLLTVANIN